MLTDEQRKRYLASQRERYHANLEESRRKAREKYQANKEKLREARRQRYRENIESERERSRKNAEARRRRRGVDPRQPATPRVRKARVTKITAAMRERRPQVPAHVRSAWARAHDNSAIRRAFPTKASLEKGDWSKEQADRWVFPAQKRGRAA